MHDGMPYGRIQGQGHEPIQGSRIENLQSREVDRQSPTGLIFLLCCCLLGSLFVLLVYVDMCFVFWLFWLSYHYLPSDWLERLF